MQAFDGSSFCEEYFGSLLCLCNNNCVTLKFCKPLLIPNQDPGGGGAGVGPSPHSGGQEWK